MTLDFNTPDLIRTKLMATLKCSRVSYVWSKGTITFQCTEPGLDAHAIKKQILEGLSLPEGLNLKAYPDSLEFIVPLIQTQEFIGWLDNNNNMVTAANNEVRAVRNTASFGR